MTDGAVEVKGPTFNPKRAAIVAAGFAAVIGWVYFSGGQNGTAYTCDSLVPEIVALSEANKSAILPVKLLDIVERKSASTTDTSVECSGVGIMSNGIKVSVNYRAYVEYDKWWIKFEPVAVL